MRHLRSALTTVRRSKADSGVLGFCLSMNNIISGGEGHLVKRKRTADIAHTRPSAAAPVMVMPCRKGSVLEVGRVKQSQPGRFPLPVGSLKPNVIELHVACQLEKSPAAHW